VFQVGINGFFMRLRRSELASVAAGLGQFDAAEEGNLVTLAAALGELPSSERAPLWELAVRRYGRDKPVEQAAGEIGMDAIRAYALLDAFAHAIARVLPPGSTPSL
jgi:hypothetical protein